MHEAGTSDEQRCHKIATSTVVDVEVAKIEAEHGSELSAGLIAPPPCPCWGAQPKPASRLIGYCLSSLTTVAVMLMIA